MTSDSALSSGTAPGEADVRIEDEVDMLAARAYGREIGAMAGFSEADLTLIATAISELARNIIDYAGRGELRIRLLDERTRQGIEIVAHDDGPGIPDIEEAMQDGFSTSNGLGLGLPGARRLMDEFEISSSPGNGTTVRAKKWVLIR
jgi:serine/threonine-protein kinase RsbT